MSEHDVADDHKRRAIAHSIKAGKELEAVTYHVKEMTRYGLGLGDRTKHLHEAKRAAYRLHTALKYLESSMVDPQ